MLIALDGKRLEPALIQMSLAGAVIMSTIPLRMGQAKPLSKSAHIAINIRTDDQMPVILHQTI
jgi:hypothetical protein